MRLNKAFLMGLLLLVGAFTVMPWTTEVAEAQLTPPQVIRVHVVDSADVDVAGASVTFYNEGPSPGVGSGVAPVVMATNSQGMVQLDNAREAWSDIDADVDNDLQQDGGIDADVDDYILIDASLGAEYDSDSTILVTTNFPLINVELKWNVVPEITSGTGINGEQEDITGTPETGPIYVFPESNGDGVDLISVGEGGDGGDAPGDITWSTLGSLIEDEGVVFDAGDDGTKDWTGFGELVWYYKNAGNPNPHFFNDDDVSGFGVFANQIETVEGQDADTLADNIEDDDLDTSGVAARIGGPSGTVAGSTYGSTAAIPGTYSICLAVWDDDTASLRSAPEWMDLCETTIVYDDTMPTYVPNVGDVPTSVDSSTTWNIDVELSDADGSYPGSITQAEIHLWDDTTTGGAGGLGEYCQVATPEYQANVDKDGDGVDDDGPGCVFPLTNAPSGSDFWGEPFTAPTTNGDIDWMVNDVRDAKYPDATNDPDVNIRNDATSGTTIFSMVGGTNPVADLDVVDTANTDITAIGAGTPTDAVTIAEGEWVSFRYIDTTDPGETGSFAFGTGDFTFRAAIDFGVGTGEGTCYEEGDQADDNFAPAWSKGADDASETSTCVGTLAPFTSPGIIPTLTADGYLGHEYTTQGTYIVELLTTDYEGLTDTDRVTVTVTDGSFDTFPPTIEIREGSSPWSGAILDPLTDDLETGKTYTYTILGWFDEGDPVDAVTWYLDTDFDGVLSTETPVAMTSMGAGSGSWYVTFTVPSTDERGDGLTDQVYGVIADDGNGNLFNNIGTGLQTLGDWTDSASADPLSVIDATPPLITTFAPTGVVSSGVDQEWDVIVTDLVDTWDVTPTYGLTVFLDFDDSDGGSACGGILAGDGVTAAPVNTDQVWYVTLAGYGLNLEADGVVYVPHPCNDYNGATAPTGVGDYPIWVYLVNGIYVADILVVDDGSNSASDSVLVTAGTTADVMTLYDGWNIIPMKLIDFQWCAPTDPTCVSNNDGSGFYPTAENLELLYPEILVVAKWNAELGSSTIWEWDYVWLEGSDNIENFYMDPEHKFGDTDLDAIPDEIYDDYPTISGDDILDGDGRVPSVGEGFAIFVDISLAGSNIVAGGYALPADDIFVDGDGDGTSGTGTGDLPDATAMDAIPNNNPAAAPPFSEPAALEICAPGSGIDCNHLAWADTLVTDGAYTTGEPLVYDIDLGGVIDVADFFFVGDEFDFNGPNGVYDAGGDDICDPFSAIDPLCTLGNDLDDFNHADDVVYLAPEFSWVDTDGDTIFDFGTGQAGSEDIWVDIAAAPPGSPEGIIVSGSTTTTAVELYAEGTPVPSTYGGGDGIYDHPGIVKDDGSAVPGAGWQPFNMVPSPAVGAPTTVQSSTILSSMCHPVDGGIENDYGLDGIPQTDDVGEDDVPALDDYPGAGTPADGIPDGYECFDPSDNTQSGSSGMGLVTWDAGLQEWKTAYAPNSDLSSIVYTEGQAALTTYDASVELFEEGTMLFVGADVGDATITNWVRPYDEGVSDPADRSVSITVPNSAPDFTDMWGNPSLSLEVFLDPIGAGTGPYSLVDSDSDGTLSIGTVPGVEDLPSTINEPDVFATDWDFGFFGPLDVEIYGMWLDVDDDAPLVLDADVIGPEVVLGAGPVPVTTAGPVSFMECEPATTGIPCGFFGPGLAYESASDAGPGLYSDGEGFVMKWDNLAQSVPMTIISPGQYFITLTGDDGAGGVIGTTFDFWITDIAAASPMEVHITVIDGTTDAIYYCDDTRATWTAVCGSIPGAGFETDGVPPTDDIVAPGYTTASTTITVSFAWVGGDTFVGFGIRVAVDINAGGTTDTSTDYLIDGVTGTGIVTFTLAGVLSDGDTVEVIIFVDSNSNNIYNSGSEIIIYDDTGEEPVGA